MRLLLRNRQRGAELIDPALRDGTSMVWRKTGRQVCPTPNAKALRWSDESASYFAAYGLPGPKWVFPMWRMIPWAGAL